MKNVANWFWGGILGFAVVAIGAGFLSGRSLPGGGAMPAAVAVPEVAPAPIERSLFGARGEDASLEPFQPPVDDAVVNRPAGWAPDTAPAASEAVRMAIVICGMGEDGTLDRRFEAIPYPLTFAVPATGELASKVTRSDPRALLIETTSSTTFETIKARFAALHAGGVITPLGGYGGDADALTEGLSGSDIFVIDGMAGGTSSFYDAARDDHVAAASRDIVIDAYAEEPYVAYMLRQSVRLARRTGVAIAVGHASPATYEALRQNLPRLVADNDIQIVPVGDLVR